MPRLHACLLMLVLAPTLPAAVVPSHLFADNAVLQRDKPIPVWGTADAGEEVAVTFAGHTVKTTTKASGDWRVDLPALPANSTPGTLVIAGKNTIARSNVLVGEVWIASGQSNMEMHVDESYDGSLDIPASARFPMIRHFQVDKQLSPTPLRTGSGAWKVAGPETTGKFSAIGYYFALDLYQALNVPVGIINTTRGGSTIRAWVDPDTLANDRTIEATSKFWAKITAEERAAYPALKAKLDAEIAAWEAAQAAAKTAGTSFTAQRPAESWAGLTGGPNDQFSTSMLYNGMMRPLEPCALRGVIWYQGEGNVGNHVEYSTVFPAMISGWRRRFAQGDFPFYWVQLADHGSTTGTGMAYMREAQSKALALPATGQAVAIDMGDSPNIHPGRKHPLGRRLARIALANTYGQKIIDRGPVFKQAAREGTGYRVSFTPVDSTHGYHPLKCPLPTLQGFELAGADRVFKPALAEFNQACTTVFVSSPDVPEPVALRYAWRDSPAAGLFNQQGLPAAPFRTDDWQR